MTLGIMRWDQPVQISETFSGNSQHTFVPQFPQSACKNHSKALRLVYWCPFVSFMARLEALQKNEVQTARHQISKDNKFRDLRQLHNMSHFKSSQSHTWQSIPLTLSKVILKFQNSSTHQNPDQSALFPSHFSCNHHQCLWKRKAEMQQPLKWTPWDKH